MQFLIGTHPHDKERASLVEQVQGLSELAQSDPSRGGRGDSENVTVAHDWVSALGYAAVEDFSAVWMDWTLVREYYGKFHQRLRKLNHHLPLIIISDGSKIDSQMCENDELLFSVMRRCDIGEKGEALVRRLGKYKELLSTLPRGMKAYLRPNGLGPFIGNSLPMLELYRQIAKVAPTDFTVLICGHSGSGKELAARTIHELSLRKDHRFVSLNCAAIPENLLESELFGYEKGAFTGAAQPKEGKFELAHEGTLFLDEIGDMPLTLQPKLLRVLEDHVVERLGGTDGTKVDIRLLAATHQDMASLVSEGKFRSDLHYRLNVIPIRLPSLASLGDDMILLTLHTLGKLTKGDRTVVRTLSWGLVEELSKMGMSGNVRELENILTRVVFASDGPDLHRNILDRVDISTTGAALDSGDKPTTGNGVLPLWEVERRAIKEALIALRGNISRVASELEISRTALYRKIEKYHLGKPNGE